MLSIGPHLMAYKAMLKIQKPSQIASSYEWCCTATPAEVLEDIRRYNIM